MRVLGINAVFHDPAAALVIDGEIVAAAEEERFSRRKHGKSPVPFATWELPEQAARYCLERAGIAPGDLDAIAYSYSPHLAPAPGSDIVADDWEGLRTLYARRAPLFLKSALPGLEPERVTFVPHHVAHAASAYLAAPFSQCSVLVLDGRGERTSHLAGRASGGELTVLASQGLPHSLGLLYEEATEHLGFRRSSDEYKVMALASYGEPELLPALRDAVRATGDGGFRVAPIDWSRMAPRPQGGELTAAHNNLACSLQRRLEEVLLDLARWLHKRTADRALVMAGGVALNCVANSFLAEHGPFEHIWVQPAAGDAGTALGAALYIARRLGDSLQPMRTAALGRAFSDAEIEAALRNAALPFERPASIAEAAAEVLARDGIVAWFQGRSELGPRALGHRSLLADPSHPKNVQRLNDVKGREQFRPVAPMVLLERAADVLEGGPIPSPFMLFTHRVKPAWRRRLAAALHVDGSARAQTVDAADEPLVAALLRAFERLTAVPAIINTSLNTAGRPMVDDPRGALELFGAAPIDALAIGPFLLRRRGL